MQLFASPVRSAAELSAICAGAVKYGIHARATNAGGISGAPVFFKHRQTLRFFRGLIPFLASACRDGISPRPLSGARSAASSGRFASCCRIVHQLFQRCNAFFNFFGCVFLLHGFSVLFHFTRVKSGQTGINFFGSQAKYLSIRDTGVSFRTSAVPCMLLIFDLPDCPFYSGRHTRSTRVYYIFGLRRKLSDMDLKQNNRDRHAG